MTDYNMRAYNIPQINLEIYILNTYVVLELGNCFDLV